MKTKCQDPLPRHFSDAKPFVWEAVLTLTGKHHDHNAAVVGVTAKYAQRPVCHSVKSQQEPVLLNTSRFFNTQTSSVKQLLGLAGLPVWFLRLPLPLELHIVFSKTLARLSSLLLATSTIPHLHTVSILPIHPNSTQNVTPFPGLQTNRIPSSCKNHLSQPHYLQSYSLPTNSFVISYHRIKASRLTRCITPPLEKFT